ncbi:hypothetical protein [Mycobacteroides abscessus]|uniref:hypothetical protein n=1 Tax=Mycobacteroides abscessus TaxID=36809 RepID=UPI0005DC8020|nr:hypothetical protein [Mycobacteroides abscessus]CPR72581.1 Uncharacterised protein [Mycobacteroides abscessus]CPV13156.1 Uncharacterised protein [Mycobacteroides abscessus]
MNRAGSTADSVVARFVVGLIGAILVSLGPIGTFPNAAAAPSIPDIDSLIDDTGPLDTRVVGINGGRAVFFSTANGLLCAQTVVKIAFQVSCAGEFPGQPPGPQVVTVGSAYSQGLGPGAFMDKPAEEYFGDTTNVAPIALAAGHKIVFWNNSATESLMCGVPTSADVVCVLKAPQEVGASSRQPVTHGFVIGPPKSWVF